MRIRDLERIEELLDFKQVSVRIAEEKVVDAVLRADGWRFFQPNTVVCKIPMPFIDTMRDDGEDHMRPPLVGWRVDRALAEAEIAVRSNLIDAASSLIELQAKTHDIFIKSCCLRKIVGIEKGDLRVDWRMPHTYQSSLPREACCHCSMIPFNAPMTQASIPHQAFCVRRPLIMAAKPRVTCCRMASRVQWPSNPGWHRAVPFQPV